jgi:hypothetical protein
MSITTIAGIARAAMLVDLNIKVYSGRKQDRKTQAEVTTAKGSGSKRAASVYKSLFADCKELDDITKYQARIRAEHYRLTKPWADNGQRLLPTKLLLEYQGAMGKCKTEFEFLVDKFVVKYDTLVAAAAFQLGTLFDRDEYLPGSQIARKFAIETSFSPLPIAGDFRVDIESEVQQQLITQYEAKSKALLAQSTQDSWTRLHKVLSNLSERLVIEEDGTKRKFHDTLVSNAEELCELLDALNVTADPDLERARSKLLDAMTGVTPKELRTEDSTRIETKRKVDAILDAFDWGVEDADADAC